MSDNQANGLKALKEMLMSIEFESEVSIRLPATMDAPRFIHVFFDAARKDPKLQACTLASWANCVFDAAAMGLAPDARGAIYLVPRGRDLTLVIGYRGFIDLLYESGVVEKIFAKTVLKGEAFTWRQAVGGGHEAYIDHGPAPDGKTGEAVTYYAAAILAETQQVMFEIMTVAEGKTIQAQATSQNSPAWKNNFDEMAKKTVLRRLMKPLPTRRGSAAENLATIQEYDNMDFRGEGSGEPSAVEKLKEDILLEDKEASYVQSQD